jgi:HlyD family secretion protein
MPVAAPKKLIILSALLLAGAAGLGSWYSMRLKRNGDGAIQVSGNIECTEVGIAFKIAGRVEKRDVDEGQSVDRGQEIARLETSDLQADRDLRSAELKAADAALAELKAGSRQEDIDAAHAALEKASAKLDELLAGSRPQEIKTAEAQRDAAKVEADRFRKELARAQRLLGQNMVTREQFDQAQAAFDVASERHRQTLEQLKLVTEGPRKEQIEQARAAKAQTAAQYDLAKNGPRKETVAQAEAKVEQARAALRAANVRLGYATVVSPLAGVVLSKNIEEGEFVAPGTPVVTVADVHKVWLRAYIEESQLGKGDVKLGQKAEVSTDAYPGKVYPGRISFISEEAEFTPKQVQTEKERTRLVYRIKIDIDNPNQELKPGMPADARIVPSGNQSETHATP